MRSFGCSLLVRLGAGLTFLSLLSSSTPPAIPFGPWLIFLDVLPSDLSLFSLSSERSLRLIAPWGDSLKSDLVKSMILGLRFWISSADWTIFSIFGISGISRRELGDNTEVVEVMMRGRDPCEDVPWLDVGLEEENAVR